MKLKKVVSVSKKQSRLHFHANSLFSTIINLYFLLYFIIINLLFSCFDAFCFVVATALVRSNFLHLLIAKAII